MAKRFTDSDKWKKPWFRKLTPIQKCFWIYLLDNCDQAGFWPVDFDLAEIFIGAPVNEKEIRNVFKQQYEELADGKKWFVRDFISFQYGELKETNRLHVFVYKIMEKQGVSTPHAWGVQGAKDKVKDKDKDIFEKGSRKKLFKKPSLHEVEAEMSARGAGSAEAQRFVDYYDSVGWVVGRSRKPMRSWLGAVANWLANRESWKASPTENRRAKLKKELEEIDYDAGRIHKGDRVIRGSLSEDRV